jgi:hypothetical protein
MMMVILHQKNASKASNILCFFEQINRRQGELHCGELQNTWESASPSQGATHCLLEGLERELKTLKP